MSNELELVVIHGAHKHLDDDKKPAVKKVGDQLVMSRAELQQLDPQFNHKTGLGERFATPAAAKKLSMKRQLEQELEGDGSSDDEAEVETESHDSEPDEPEAEEAPAPVPTAPRRGKKGRG